MRSEQLQAELATQKSAEDGLKLELNQAIVSELCTTICSGAQLGEKPTYY